MKFKTITMLLLAGMLVACNNDEPTPSGGTAIQVKSEADRTILIGAENGKVYNMKDGSVYATLPGCSKIANMTMHGEDYYVAGKTTNGMMTYWVNGEAVKQNVSGNTYDIARSFDNIYFLAVDTKAAIYRNGSRINETLDIGVPVALAANGENFYAVGNEVQVPKLWTKSGVTDLDKGGTSAHATSIDLRANSQGITHYISGYKIATVNGIEITSPCLWRNGTLLTLPLNFTDQEKNNNVYRSGQGLDVAHLGQKTYVVGYRTDGVDRRATVWISSTDDDDDVKTYWQADGNVDAKAQSVLVYGADVYVMTVERNRMTNTYCTRIWMNHELKGTVNGIVGVDFVVI